MNGIQHVGKIDDVEVYMDKGVPQLRAVDRTYAYLSGTVHSPLKLKIHTFKDMETHVALSDAAKKATSDISGLLDEIQLELYEVDGSAESEMRIGEWSDEDVDQACVRIGGYAKTIQSIIYTLMEKRQEILKGK